VSVKRSFNTRHIARTLRRAFVLSAMVIAVLALSAAGGVAAPAGLVAAYAFDEGTGTTVADASGTGNTGTVANTTWTNSGKYGKALVFNGTGSRVNVPNDASLQLSTEMTLEGWVNPTTVSNAWRDVIYKGDDNYYLEATSTGGSRPVGGGIIGGATAEARGGTALATATWTHLALTYDGSNVRLYLNGVQAASIARTGTIRTSTNPLQIGGDNIYGQFFRGAIDEVRVYNRALTAAEIQTDMSAPIGGGTSDMESPTAPGTLSATAASSTQINLSWGAATDNVGVTGYRIERCQGAGCSNFTQIAAPPGTGTTYNDTGLTASTSYSYRVRAVDAATNPGPYSNNASTSTLADDGPPAPVAAYAFDEGAGTTTADASNNGNGGTTANTTWASSGKYGKALVFNGTNARVSVPDSASLHLSTGMTLEAWVNPATVGADWRDLIYKGNDNYYLMESSDHGGAPAAGGTFAGANANAFASSSLPTNTWSHVAATYDGATLRLYLNGSLVGSSAKTGNIASSTNQLQIGGDSIYGQYFNGLIDEVRIYNAPLSAAAIQVDMATPVGGGGSSDTQPPSAPGTLSASAVSSSEIDLSWGPATDNVAVSGYQILRCQGALCANFAVLAQPPGVATTYKDTGLSANTSYSYEVRALDAAGNLGPVSNAATATSTSTDTIPTSAPGTLTATATSSTRINLAWGAATDNVGVTGYRIDRCQGAGCTDFSHLAQLTGTGTTYSDTPVSSNTTYRYQVRALDAEGNQGPYSNAASATTGALGVVAAYSFDEGAGTTVADSSGNGNTGTISNATWAAAGKYGAALLFNGTNARVNIPNSSSLQLTSGMTLEAWVNPATVSNAWRDVIYKGNDNYYLGATTSPTGGPGGGGTFGGTGADVVGSSALPTNTWSHLALTYDNASLRLYVNGILADSQARTGAIATSTNQLQIGGDSIYGQYFNGIIDDVRIYNSAISAAQIQADMDQAGTGVPTAPTNLIASVTSSTQIDLTWGASTDTAGVTGYRVERCQGEGCSSFTQIAAPSATNYSDTGLTPGTSYSYRVRAIDAAGKLGPYSATATGFTGLVVTPRQAALTPGQTQQFGATVPGGGSPAVTWSVDGLTGGSGTVGTITTSGLYTAPATAGTHVIRATTLDQTLSATATAFISDYTGTFTYHNDNMRTGQNLEEVVLNPSNVNSSSFGKLFSLPLDGVALASPLYVVNVSIPGQGLHNVVYVATEHDSVYAYDANSGSTTPLWKKSFIDPANGITTVPAADTGECCDIAPEIGITSTPVIDKNTNTIYVVAKTKEVAGGTTRYVQRLHALDLSTGNEKLGGPVVLQASVPGTGAGSTNGQLPLDPLRENQRTGLLLLNGVLYFGFASHGDNQPYHGWILGYNASTLQQTLAFCLTPDTEGAGVWMSGAGIASDSTGSLYYITGDGPFDGNTGGSNWGDSYIKMTTAGGVTDYFTPFNQDLLNAGNHDLGSGGALLLPDQPGPHPHLMVSSGKDGTIYLVDRDDMGHYSPTTNNIVQTLPNIFPNGSPEPGNFSAPVYYNGYVFFGPLGDKLQAFKLTNGLLSTSATFRSTATFPDRGPSMAISASGSSGGILWAVQRNGTSSPGVLYAYDPMNSSGNVLKELYNSGQAGTRDTMGVASKFSIPLIANGKVYVAGTNTLTVYGLLP
jgi:fibronectin type 3 domain-containing protein